MSQANPFDSAGGNLTGFARDILPVTASDTEDVADGVTCIGLFASGAGNVTFVTASGNTRTIPVSAQRDYPIGFTRVLATGTTATGLYAYLG